MMICEDMQMPDNLTLWNLPTEESTCDEMLYDEMAARDNAHAAPAPARQSAAWLKNISRLWNHALQNTIGRTRDPREEAFL